MSSHRKLLDAQLQNSRLWKHFIMTIKERQDTERYLIGIADAANNKGLEGVIEFLSSIDDPFWQKKFAQLISLTSMDALTKFAESEIGDEN